MISEPSRSSAGNYALCLAPNYVWRSYRGGSVLRRFRQGVDTVDDHFPEDWLASTVQARNGGNTQGADEGLSRVQWAGGSARFCDLQAEQADYFPKGVDGFGVLLKLLDSAERLHIQAHPDDAFVAEKLGGGFGKTECWYILSTRDENAFVYLGFQNPPTQEQWRYMVHDQDIPAILSCFEPIAVKPGDCLMVPAGVPHAIGAGVFMMELQQPSDWVVRCEATVGDHTLSHVERYMGLELEDCLPLFDYSCYSADAWRQKASALATDGDWTEEEVIEAQHRKFFRLRRFRGRGLARMSSEGCPGVLIMLEGAGRVLFGSSGYPVVAGQTLLLPADDEALIFESAESWSFLIAQPPAR